MNMTRVKNENKMANWVAETLYAELCRIEGGMRDDLPESARIELESAIEPFSWDDHDRNSIAEAIGDLCEWAMDHETQFPE